MSRMPDVMTFEEMEHHLRKRLAKFRSHPDWEDAVQEGRIRIWQDLSEGTKDHPHIVFRAVKWGQALMFSPAVRPTGYPARRGAQPGVARKHAGGDATREKIRNYQDEYRQLHGTLPNSNQIASALGMDPSNTRRHLKKMATGETGWHHPGLPLLADGRVDLKSIVFEELKFTTSEDTDLGWNEPHEKSFEDDFLTSALAREAMSRLTSAQREVIYMTFWQGYPMSGYCKIKGVSEATGYARKYAALATLRDFYNSVDISIEDYV